MMNKGALLTLFAEYEHQYDSLAETISDDGLRRKYGKGGEMLHRGALCPSPIYDLVIGNVRRGRVLMQPPKDAQPDYVYYFCGDKLRIADKYDDALGRCTREYLLYQKHTVIAPRYCVLDMPWHGEMEGLSVCEYQEDGRIHSWMDLFRRCASESPSEEDFEVHSEEYCYDGEGHLSRARMTTENLGYLCEQTYSFSHDADGRIASYQVETCINGGEVIKRPVVYTIPPGKRRKV